MDFNALYLVAFLSSLTFELALSTVGPVDVV